MVQTNDNLEIWTKEGMLEKPYKKVNQIAPGVIICEPILMGQANELLPFTYVASKVSIGNDNHISSHVSIGLGAHIGDNNRISAFVCLDSSSVNDSHRASSIGDRNYLGTFSRIAKGIAIGNNNYIGSGVVLGPATKVKDCRAHSATKGDYIAAKSLITSFNNMAIARNSAQRLFNGVDVLPGEFVIFDNVSECIARFRGDGTSNDAN